jgi:ADP-ribosylation factor-like protein 8
LTCFFFYRSLVLSSGKTTLLQVLSDGKPTETAPTIGLNVRMVKRGGITMKCWDLGGQSQYRAEWGRYTRGCNVIIFVVDANAMGILPDAKIELHRLLEDRSVSCSLSFHFVLPHPSALSFP